MSVCSAAVGVLWFIAVLHIVLSAVLGALIVGVCYYGKRKERETRHKVHITQDSVSRARSRALLELESPDKLYLSNPKQLGSRPEADSPPLDEPDTPETVAKDDLGLYTVETDTEIGKRVSFERPSSSAPSVEEVELRKRSRVSIISNISNRFRKSMDLDSFTRDDSMRLVREKSSSSSEREPTVTDLMDDLLDSPTEVEVIVSSDVISHDNGDVVSHDNGDVVSHDNGQVILVNDDTTEIIMSNNESEC